MNTMHGLIPLIRRELWESPIAFRWTPIVIGVLMIILLVMGAIFTGKIDGQQLFTASMIREFAENDPEQRAALMRFALLGLTPLFNTVLMLVLFFYLASSLYDERKDRSILFWKSLPVSDTATVTSKFLTAALVAPFIYLLIAAIVQIIALLVFSGYTLAAGESVWSVVWAPSRLHEVWATLLVAIPVQALWALPLYGWLLLCSAFAPRLPWLIAIAVPGLIGLFQNYIGLLREFRLPDINLWTLFLGRIGNAILPVNVQIDEDSFDASMQTMREFFSLETVLERLTTLNLWLGVLVGLAFLAGAIWLRGRATDR